MTYKSYVIYDLRTKKYFGYNSDFIWENDAVQARKFDFKEDAEEIIKNTDSTLLTIITIY